MLLCQNLSASLRYDCQWRLRGEKVIFQDFIICKRRKIFYLFILLFISFSVSERRVIKASVLKISKKKVGIKKKPHLIQFYFFHGIRMSPSLVKCLLHHAGLVCHLQKSLHLSCSPSIRLPAHVSLSQAAKS